jgi:hypothetical protein
MGPSFWSQVDQGDVLFSWVMQRLRPDKLVCKTFLGDLRSTALSLDSVLRLYLEPIRIPAPLPALAVVRFTAAKDERIEGLWLT